MTSRTPPLLACLLFSAFVATCGSTRQPSGIVHEFYTNYIALRPGGLPAGATLDRLRPFLSRRLAGLIDGALAYQEQFIRNHPGDKPPFVDGDFFSSLFEGPQSFTIVRTEPQAEAVWNVRVHFRYHGADWEDVVVVTREDGRYVIDDVVFSGAGEFNPPGRLSDTLAQREE